jgi:hypothetical protein
VAGNRGAGPDQPELIWEGSQAGWQKQPAASAVFQQKAPLVNGAEQLTAMRGGLTAEKGPGEIPQEVGPEVIRSFVVPTVADSETLKGRRAAPYMEACTEIGAAPQAAARNIGARIKTRGAADAVARPEIVIADAKTLTASRAG